MTKKHLNLHLIMIFIFFYISLFLHTVTVVTAVDDSSQPSYQPKETINLDCGSSVTSPDRNHRIWDGDSKSKFFISEQGKNGASITANALQPPKSDDPIPYSTARLSRFEFTYSFPVTPGQKFIRLYFYPVSYNSNFDTSKALFSVKTGGFTLLSNFSASLTANALTANALNLEGFMKEFCLNVLEDEENSTPMINLTFTPNSYSFAFVNGIEILSMPTNLYYSKDNETGANFIGGQKYPIQNYSAMEMMYHINIGGNSISPKSDSGLMYRRWESEDLYLTKPGWSVLPDGGIGATIHYTQNTPPYTAPPEVYKTARSMGNVDHSLIKSYNLTWDFPVDSNFDYLVRLHFCELQFEMNNTGDRVFIIYIADQTAETSADVIKWSGGKFIPVYRDYVVFMFGRRGEKKLNLSIALRANPDDSMTSYTDAILNGVEIFKLNDTTGNLAGPNPDPVGNPTSTPLTPTGHGKGKSNKTTIIGVTFGVVIGLALLFVVGLLIFKGGRNIKDARTSEATALWDHVSLSTTTKSIKSQSSSLPSDLCRYFSLAEIKAATKNFDDIFTIGVGGFGNVYKGCIHIDGGTKPVAIKRLKSDSSQGAHEFKTEIEMLSQLRHLHLVSLIGYCNDDSEMILVYDYMSHGTLRDHLYNTKNPPLLWTQRLEICIGAARGLHYLHTGAKHMIIHRDVKTTNILLDEKWVAKVSDFGLSRIGPIGMSKAHVSTVVKGSFGYLDPEYYRRQQLTEKSDVYSFGVVLCEVLSGRPPIIKTVEKKQISLAEWARSCYRQNGTLDRIVDQNLKGKIAPECLKKYGEIAMSCMWDNGTERPSMNDVVWALEFALQMQNSANERVQLSDGSIGMEDEDEVPFMNDVKDDKVMFTSSCEMTTTESKSSGLTHTSASGDTSNVFSEFYDPKGR